MSRPIYAIARDIKASWPKVSPYAKPYLDAMSDLNSINDSYYMDTAHSVILYFLSNAQSYKGERAREIKLELKALLATAKH